MTRIPRTLRHLIGRTPVGPIALAGLLALACEPATPPTNPPADDGPVAQADGYHVHPGDDIQAAVEAAARNPTQKVVKVHAGTYAPRRAAQAMVWLNAAHEGITLEAVGDVLLTAANPELSDPAAKSHPAVVNHVVYFGDGISRRTTLRGFKITGANDFVTREPPVIQPDLADPKLTKEAGWFYTDGGAIKIFGRSYPTIENVEIYDNFSNPCGGGISIEHRGFNDTFLDQDVSDDARSVLIRNAIFRNNRAQVTGPAVDLLFGSSAIIENALFLGNIANTGENYLDPEGQGYNEKHGSGALTVFPGSHVHVVRSTFTGNWNAVDDKGRYNRYVDSIFWKNDAPGGIAKGARYELDVEDGVGVRGNVIHGEIEDLRGSVDPQRNRFDAPDPDFDAEYRPRAPGYEAIGYRPFEGV